LEEFVKVDEEKEMFGSEIGKLWYFAHPLLTDTIHNLSDRLDRGIFVTLYSFYCTVVFEKEENGIVIPLKPNPFSRPLIKP
jgi:hypothetical protein